METKETLISCSLLKAKVRNDLDADRICGYGTSRCRRYCKRQEIRIGRCPNTYPCCLKKWRDSSLNPMKDKNPEEPGP
uniref:Beta-defensin n=1 Tax=Sus scrofa TaxID=9823 RepID=A0A8D1GRE0_PIG